MALTFRSSGLLQTRHSYCSTAQALQLRPAVARRAGNSAPPSAAAAAALLCVFLTLLLLPSNVQPRRCG
jgi:hypothetical protein